MIKIFFSLNSDIYFSMYKLIFFPRKKIMILINLKKLLNIQTEGLKILWLSINKFTMRGYLLVCDLGLWSKGHQSGTREFHKQG